MSQSETPDVCRWYVVHTKTKQEERADCNLRASGIETVAPKVRDLRATRTSAGVCSYTTALFPGYIFARFVVSLMFVKVRLTRGVHGVVRFGGVITPLDDEVVDLIKSRVGEDGFVQMAGPQPGDSVEIVGGPMRSVVGIFERNLRGCDRVAILLASMGGQTRVEVPGALIRSIAG